MSNSVIIGILIALFLVLSQGADILVVNIKALASRLQTSVFMLGLILGMFTSIPELVLGISSAFQGAADISVGNLLGGIVVLLGLVLGLAIIFHRQIQTDGQVSSVIHGPLLFLLPIILALKGYLNRWDGLVFIIAYFAVIYYSYWQEKNKTNQTNLKKAKPDQSQTWSVQLKGLVQRLVDWFKNFNFKKLLTNHHFWLAVLGFVLITGSSQLITYFSIILLDRWQWSQLAVGVLIFSIGTNLPEIAVTFRALIKKTTDLSISHLLGSCISNILVLGVLLQFNNLSVEPMTSFLFMAGSIILVSGLFVWFYRTEQRFQRWEGVVLLAGYLFFLISQLVLAI